MTIAVRARTLIDGHGKDPVRGAVIVVEGDAPPEAQSLVAAEAFQSAKLTLDHGFTSVRDRRSSPRRRRRSPARGSAISPAPSRWKARESHRRAGAISSWPSRSSRRRSVFRT